MPKFPTGVLSIGTAEVAPAQATADVAKVKSLKGQNVKSEKEINKAAKDFEALLLHQMMKSMFETVDRTGFLGNDSNQADIMRDMFTQSISDEVAKGRGIGVADVVKREILKREKASEK